MAFKIWLVIICTVTLSGLFTFAYRASKSARRDIIKRRLMVDLKLIAKRHQLRLSLSILVIAYIQSVFGRNLAFYLHRPLTDYVDHADALLRHRLYDIGHAATPDWSGSEFLVSLNELWQYCMAAAVIITAMLPYIFELRPDIRDNLVVGGTSAEAREARRLNHSKIQTTNVVVRLLQAVALGHVLRMPTFLGTSLPGPSPHCIGAIEAQNRPRDLVHILWFPHAGANCGDLVFSGHMLFATTALCLVTHYIDLLVGRPTATRVFLGMLPLFATQIVSILASRAHYTVDIVTGVTIASLFWVVQTKVLFAREWQPDATDDAEVKSATDVEEDLLLLGSVKTVKDIDDGDDDDDVCIVHASGRNKGSVTIDKAAAEKAAFSDMYALAVAPLDPGVSLNSPGLILAAQQQSQQRQRARASSSAKSTPGVRAATLLELPTFDQAGQTPLEIAIGRPECDIDDQNGSNGVGDFALVATDVTAAAGVPQRESARRLQWEAEQSLPGATTSSRCSAQSTRSRRSATPARAGVNNHPIHAAHGAADV